MCAFLVQKPIIAICGTTGVGKSRLAIELALSLQNTSSHSAAKIINADSMQVYRGLDIITNKTPFEQQRGVEHLLLGFKHPSNQYEVGEWVNDATNAIDETHRAGQLPIIVGGTSYWIQHLLFTNLLPSSRRSLSGDIQVSYSEDLVQSLQQLPDELLHLFNNLPSTPPFSNGSSDEAYKLYSLLSHLDPSMASRWHWKDSRKVLRNLQIIKEYGRAASDVVTSLWQTSSMSRYRGLIFWLYADGPNLDECLDKRVDDMVSGLLDEVRDLYQTPVQLSCGNLGRPLDVDDEEFRSLCTKGIYQAIGFKEFSSYFKSSTPSVDLVKDALANMKQNTRKYARRQVKWILNKLIPAVEAANKNCLEDKTHFIGLYLLDATDVNGKWELDVLGKAVDITRSFIANEKLPDPVSISPIAQSMLRPVKKPENAQGILKARKKIVCSLCTTDKSRPVMLDMESEWMAHQNSKAHKIASSRRKTRSHGFG